MKLGIRTSHTVCLLLMGLAFQRMPVAETTAIGFLGPMLVILAAVVISEWVSAKVRGAII